MTIAPFQVYIAECPGYDTQAVEVALYETVQSLGSSVALFPHGPRVIIKLDLQQAQPPERGVTTHPTLVLAVCRWVRGAGAALVVPDSPVGLFAAQRLPRLYEVLDFGHCIRCYWGHKVGPEDAVELHPPLLARLFNRAG